MTEIPTHPDQMAMDLAADRAATTDPTGRPDKWPPSLYTDRLACDPECHLLACHNPWLDRTWCVCGKVQIDGEHTVWLELSHRNNNGTHSHHLGDLIGWERYTLGDCACHPDGVVQP